MKENNSVCLKSTYIHALQCTHSLSMTMLVGHYNPIGYIHTYTHTYTYTYILKHIYIDIYIYTHTHIYIYNTIISICY